MASPSLPTRAPDAHADRFPRLLAAFAPVLVAVVIGGGYMVVLRGQFTELQALRAKRAVAQTLPELAARADAFAAAAAAFAKIPESDRDAVDALAPAREDIPGLFAAIDAAAQRVGITITAMDVTREDPPSDLTVLRGQRVLSVGVGVRNVDYPHLKAFLDVLAASRRLIDVRSVQFSPEGLTADIRLRAYTVD